MPFLLPASPLFGRLTLAKLAFRHKDFHSTDRLMLKLLEVVGPVTDPVIADQLHHLEHHGRVETITLSEEDTQRRRLRVVTDAGTECALMLDRSAQLYDGAVVLLTEERAVVVRTQEPDWLRIQPRDTAAALEIGYFSGNMHWTVRFAGDVIEIAMQGEAASYLERLAPFLSDGRARHVHSH
jgi:urease accessory protein